MNKKLYIVVLAGGKGERLWPLSRTKKPKQLLPFYAEKSLLEHTVTRVSSLTERERLWVVTTEQHKTEIEQLVGGSVGKVFAEPASRNTAPAILLTCNQIKKEDPNAIVLFVPADQFVGQDDLYLDALCNAVNFASDNSGITLLGLKPTYPAIGYGYIEYDQSQKLEDKAKPLSVLRFHEKPNKQTAEMYCSFSNMLWNIGVFCGTISSFISEYVATAPNMVKQLDAYLSDNFAYHDIEHISIDHAVLEKSSQIYVLPTSFTWSDVGDLETFISLHDVVQMHADQVVSIQSQENVISVPKKLVALIGVEDLCIVETDDVLLIAKRDQTQRVKEVLKALREKNGEHYL